MAPRNNDAETSYHKKNCPGEGEIDVENLIPNLMHKKHKVVKLVKCQLRKMQEEGLQEFEHIKNCNTLFLCDSNKSSRKTCCCKSSKNFRTKGLQVETRCLESSSVHRHSNNHKLSGFCCCFYTLGFVLAIFLLILLIVWISSGPLSNSTSHTPIPASSFVRTDNVCSLEKKYLLRWSNFE